MIIKNHLISDIKYIKSPNFNNRPQNTCIDLLVIHSISLPPKVYGTDHIEQFFLNCLDSSLDPFYEEIKNLKVSAHLLIKRTGEVIQFVPFNMRAWHAGESTFKGSDDCNSFSIGVELVGSEDDTFEDILFDNDAKNPESVESKKIFEGISDLRYGHISKDPFTKKYGEGLLEELLEE